MICTILITISPPPPIPPHRHIPPCYSVGDYWIPLRSPWKQCNAQKFLTLPSPFIKWSLAKIDILHPLIVSNVLVVSTLRKRDQIFFFFFFLWMFCLPSYSFHWYNDHKRQSAHLKPQFALLGKLRAQITFLVMIRTLNKLLHESSQIRRHRFFLCSNNLS